jgi:penicillin-binding protein 1A
MVSMLQGAVERGTGSAARAVGKPVAGKTGTTNDYTDAWFVGFSPDLAVGVYIGFDTPRTLGNRETGGGNAAPIFRDFMAQALADKPATPFRTPPGVRLVRVNAQTGALAGPGDGRVIVEAFRAGTEPRPDRPNGVVPAGFGTLVQPVPQAGEAEQSVGGSPGGLY